MKEVLFVLLLMTAVFTSSAQQSYSSFNHVSINVKDLNRSEVFYSKLFRLDSIPDPFPEFRVTWFKMGKNLALHLFENRNMVENPGTFHLCFSIASMDEFLGRLKSANIPYFNGKGELFEMTVRTDRVKQIYFKDPDGYKIEVNDDKF